MTQPKLLMKPVAYKTDKLYSIIPDNGDGDFTLLGYVGNGTRVNEDGFIESVSSDRPRIDHLNGCGLLIEPGRTNRSLYSGASTNLTNFSAVITANDIISPDGTKNATKLADESSIANAYVLKQATVSVPSDTQTLSWFVKFGDTDDIMARIQTESGTEYFEILLNRDGSIVLSTEFGTTMYVSSKSVDYGNGWLRFEITTDMDSADTDLRIYIYPGTGDQDAQGYCWVWGFQCENGTYATSYIPTEATVVGRINDVLSCTSVITNEMIGYTNGVMLVDLSYNESATRDGSNQVIRIGTNAGQVYVYHNGTGVSAIVNSTDATANTYYVDSPSRAIVAFNISHDNVDVWINGIKVGSTGKNFLFTAETLALHGDNIAAKIHEIALYNRALTDEKMKRITQ